MQAQVGGAAARNKVARPKITTSPGAMNATPPTTPPRGPAKIIPPAKKEATSPVVDGDIPRAVRKSARKGNTNVASAERSAPDRRTWSVPRPNLASSVRAGSAASPVPWLP